MSPGDYTFPGSSLEDLLKQAGLYDVLKEQQDGKKL